MSKLEDILQRLQNRSPLAALTPKQIWDQDLSEEIKNLSEEELTGGANPSALAVKATRSGLLLWNDDLYGSHELSQDIPEAIGSYWHGIMHRQEADFSNAKYWFARTGEHHIFAALFKQAQEILPEVKSWGEWNAATFVDVVQDIVRQKQEQSERGEQARQVQALEFSLLLEYSRGIS